MNAHDYYVSDPTNFVPSTTRRYQGLFIFDEDEEYGIKNKKQSKPIKKTPKTAKKNVIKCNKKNNKVDNENNKVDNEEMQKEMENPIRLERRRIQLEQLHRQQQQQLLSQQANGESKETKQQPKKQDAEKEEETGKQKANADKNDSLECTFYHRHMGILVALLVCWFLLMFFIGFIIEALSKNRAPKQLSFISLHGPSPSEIKVQHTFAPSVGHISPAPVPALAPVGSVSPAPVPAPALASVGSVSPAPVPTLAPVGSVSPAPVPALASVASVGTISPAPVPALTPSPHAPFTFRSPLPPSPLPYLFPSPNPVDPFSPSSSRTTSNCSNTSDMPNTTSNTTTYHNQTQNQTYSTNDTRQNVYFVRTPSPAAASLTASFPKPGARPSPAPSTQLSPANRQSFNSTSTLHRPVNQHTQDQFEVVVLLCVVIVIAGVATLRICIIKKIKLSKVQPYVEEDKNHHHQLGLFSNSKSVSKSAKTSVYLDLVSV